MLRGIQIINENYFKFIRSDAGCNNLTIVKKQDQQIILDGVIYNLQKLKDHFGLNACDNICELVLEIENAGLLQEFLKKADGVFCLYILNKRTLEVKVITDRNGLKMNYYTMQNKTLYVSDSVTNILKYSEKNLLDWSSLTTFVELGYLMGDTTFFQNIKLMKPASILCYQVRSSKLQQSYYWTWAECSKLTCKFDDAVELVGLQFLNSVKKRFDADKSIGVSLSGGLDSRAILAAVKKLEPDYRGYCYTFGDASSQDVKIAKNVAKIANWDHEFFELSENNWFDPRLSVVIATDGMKDLKHLHGVEFGKSISSKIEINLNGYLGDVVAGGGWMNKDHFNERANDLNTRDFYMQFAALGYHSDTYFDIRNREPALHVSRARRFTNMGITAASLYVEQRLPFFDNELLETLMMLPEEYRSENKLYSEILKQLFPEFFTSIPWQKTGKPVGVYSKANNNRFLSRLERKLKNYLSKSKYFYSDYSDWIKKDQFRCWLYENIELKSSVLNGRLNKPSIFNLLDMHLEGIKDYSNEILRLLTLEYYMRYLHNQGVRFS